MRVPTYLPNVRRDPSENIAVHAHASPTGLTAQGCNWLACAAAVARCVAQPDPARCIQEIAPSCGGCL